MAKPKRTKFNFTAIALKKLTPGTAAFEVRDESTKGLTLRVLPSGKKVFRWAYFDTQTGKQCVKTFGEFGNSAGFITLARAGELLRAEKKQHEAKRRGLIPEQGEKVSTVAQLAEKYYATLILPNRKNPKEARQVIDKHIIGNLGGYPLELIDTQILADMIEGVAKHAPIWSRKLLGITKQMFAFAAVRGYLKPNPAADIEPKMVGIKPHTQGKRHLTSDEIVGLYHALDHSTCAEGQRVAVKLLLLTGVRSAELLQARWSDIDLEAATWVIPVEHQKVSKANAHNRQPFEIPLPTQSVSLFRVLKERAGDSPFVMASRCDAKTHYASKTLGRAVRALLAERTLDGALLLPIEPFTPHDLRRSLRTHLTGTLKVPPQDAEKCLNHRMPPILATYDKSPLLEERQQALQRFSDWVDRITLPGGNVTELRA